jgi:hypothetical protein
MRYHGRVTDALPSTQLGPVERPSPSSSARPSLGHLPHTAGHRDRQPGPLPRSSAVWVAGGVLALAARSPWPRSPPALPAPVGIYAFLREIWGPLPGVPLRLGPSWSSSAPPRPAPIAITSPNTPTAPRQSRPTARCAGRRPAAIVLVAAVKHRRRALGAPTVQNVTTARHIRPASWW